MLEAVDTRPTALTLEGVVKSFGGTRALDGVSLELETGKIHALLGGNGSGKSTLVKILAGVYQADDGGITVGGHRYDARAFSAARAREAGLRFVHQQQSTFSALTIAENLALGHGFETGVAGRVRWRAQQRRARELLERFEIDADPRTSLAHCGIATQTMVAIARALQDVGEGSPRVLVLDEPTAPLPPSEVKILLSALQRYAFEDQTILYVTHRLEEVLEIADRATVLRDGRVAGTLDSASIDHESLVSLIMGRKIQAAISHQVREADREVRLHCDGLAGGPIRNATVSVAAGEVVGVAGLLGSGRSSLLRLIVGDLRREAGQIALDAVPVEFDGPADAARAGVAYTPEDRFAAAAFLELSVRENVGIASMGRYFWAGRLHHRAERRDAIRLLSDYQVKAESTEAALSTLSGGNQQKLLLARWFRLEPRLLLLDEPTQGVDVGARADIWRFVHGAVDDGAAALVVLSDYEELVKVCDRVIVLHDGRTDMQLVCERLTESTLEHLVLSGERITT